MRSTDFTSSNAPVSFLLPDPEATPESNVNSCRPGSASLAFSYYCSGGSGKLLAALDWISLTKRSIKGEAERVSKSSS